MEMAEAGVEAVLIKVAAMGELSSHANWVGVVHYQLLN